MASKREAALLALTAALAPLGTGTRKVERNATLPEKLPADGLIVVRDGAPGAPVETYLASPPVYVFEHRAEIELVVQKTTQPERDSALDALLVSIGPLIAADRTLGGAVDYAEHLAAEPLDVTVEGGLPLKGATVPVVLHYDTQDPLG